MFIDSDFSYKNSLRFLILLKLNYNRNLNTYNIYSLLKLYFFFSLVRLTDKNKRSIYIIFIFFIFFLVKILFYLSINLFIFRLLIL
jgi:hypothetical protein